MSEKIIVGPINKGLRTDRTPFIIDNDSFPVLINSYQWRGRVKRKRGTSLLGRLNRSLTASTGSSIGNGSLTTIHANLFSLLSLDPVYNASIVPGTVVSPIVISVGSPSVIATFSDTLGIGTLTVVTGTGVSGTINYLSGDVSLVFSAAPASSVTVITMNYYPGLPVMGLEELNLNPSTALGTIAFDTQFSYDISTASPYSISDVSFYKNPTVDSTNMPSYVRKTTQTPLKWNGTDYQQFWTSNYQGALWATNGITVPFITANIGMQYKAIISVTVASTTTASLNITAHGLVIGDFVFINEVVTTTGINFQTGYVVTVTDANNVVVKFPFANISTNGTGGIAQYLTNTAITGKDCLRWYDGNPSDNSAFGWVNFSPPLTHLDYSISDLPADQYYLVGARMVVPFKDRMVFIGPVVQTSVAGSQVYLQDTVVYSQVGTPYYTASFTGDEAISTTVYHPLLLPKNQTSTASAYFEDIVGFGGSISTGLNQAIVSVNTNEDVLIMGFSKIQTRFVFTGNDVLPFTFFTINSELGALSTFSTISLDRGVVAVGNNGITLTDQTGSQRIDLQIPDQIFQFNLLNNGAERVCSQRDFIQEWVYFSYLNNQNTNIYPNQTLQYNYRDESWAIFNETYTTYGTFRRVTGYTWATIGSVFPSWEVWNEPWNSGSSTLLQPQVIGGTPQGFILFRDDGTSEGASIAIQNISFPVNITGITQANPAVITANNQFIAGQNIKISGVVGMTNVNGHTYGISASTPTTITIVANSTTFSPYTSGGVATPVEPVYSPNHCLNSGDYFVVEGCQGTIGNINGNVYSASNVTPDGFQLTSDSYPTRGSYLGGGVIRRMYIPFIQTKQFPPSWGMSRKTRIGAQQYLLSTTTSAFSQITLQIYLSQDNNSPYNAFVVPPSVNSPNDSLIYTNVLYTAPEYPISNVNGQSLGVKGNGVSTTMTFSLPSVLVPPKLLISVGSIATFTDNGSGGFTVTGTGVSLGSSVNYFTGKIVLVFSVAPLNQVVVASYAYASNNLQNPTAASQSQIWHRVSTSLVGDTVQLGFTMSDQQMRDPSLGNQFAEIELHAFIIDVQQSQLLS